MMAAQPMAHFGVNIVLDYGHLFTVVSVPYRGDDDPDYNGDDSAIDAAVALWRDHYGFDLSGVRWCDVTVELEGVTE